MVRVLASEYLVLWLSLAYFLVIAAVEPSIASPRGLRNLLLNMLPLAVLAVGEMLVVITAGIDLSLTAVISLGGVLGASVMTGEQGLGAAAVGLLVMLAVGLAIGGLHGFSVAWLGMPPFLVTLTSLMFFSGAAVWYTQSQSIAGLPDVFVNLWYYAGPADRWPLQPPPLVIAGGVALAAHFLLSRTLWGRYLYAIGHSQPTSLISGVPIKRTILLAYMASSLCAAIAGMLYMARLETARPELVSETVLLDCIGATVIGGVSLFGGRGSVRGVLLGVLFITLVSTSLPLLDLDYWHVMMVKGAVILLAAALDALRTRLVAEVRA